VVVPKGLVRIKRRELTSMAREMIKRELTIVPCATSSFDTNLDPIRLWVDLLVDQEQYLFVPRGYYYSVIKKRFDLQCHFPFSIGRSCLAFTSPISLREGQEEMISGAIQLMTQNSFGGAIIEAPTGSGKTIFSLEVARRLNRKTLVVVHTNVLKDQWVENIKKFTKWSVGIIQNGVIDTENKDVCVVMIHTLSMSEYIPEWISDEFGLVIYDEVHISGAREFQKALFRLRPRYILGLSGTLNRKDKADNVFKYGIGSVVQSKVDLKVLTPTVYFIDTKYIYDDIGIALDKERVQFLASVIYDEHRNALIIKNAMNAVQAGRHVLILSDRVDHVGLLYAALSKKLPGIKVGMIVGSTKKKERAYVLDSQVLCATTQLLGIGFDNPRLDTLIFATPSQSPFQAVGRILRQHPDKKSPVVIDLVDTSDMARIFGLSRRRKYLEKNWVIKGDECLKKQLRRDYGSF